MPKENELQGLSLPSPEPEKKPAGKMPWQHRVMYTVETPEGDMMTLGPKELERYAAGAKRTET